MGRTWLGEGARGIPAFHYMQYQTVVGPLAIKYYAVVKPMPEGYLELNTMLIV